MAVIGGLKLDIIKNSNHRCRVSMSPTPALHQPYTYVKPTTFYYK